MSTLNCRHCSAPSTNGVVLCARCQTTARKALSNISAYHADLFSLPGRVFGVRGGSRISDPTGSAAALSVRDQIDDEAAATKSSLVVWMRRLVRDHHRAFYPTEDTVDALTRVLVQQLRSIATMEWAGEFIADVLGIEKRLRKTVESNKGLWYAGVCGKVLDPDADPETAEFCTRVLYADPDKDRVFCPVCRTTWPVIERRRILLGAARDEVTNVATIARACAVLLGDQTSQAKLERRIQNWIDRGLIERRGSRDVDGRLRKVYRLGDVLDMLTDTLSGATGGRSA